MTTRYSFRDYYRYACLVYNDMQIGGFGSHNTVDFAAMLAYHLWETNANLITLIDKELLALPKIDDEFATAGSWKWLKSELLEKCKQV